MDLLIQFQNLLFNKDFWLPENVTWSDLQNRPGDDTYKAQPKDLWLIFPIAGLIFLTRLVFERLIAFPIGSYYGLSSKKYEVIPNATYEKIYKNSAYPSDDVIKGLSKQCDQSERQIQRWFRRRRNCDKPSMMTKFTETAWRFFFYLLIFIYGLYTVMQKSWFYDVKDCWRGYPKQHVPTDVYWYYIMELGFYISLLFSQFADVKRKDFWEQFLHHITTILLMWFSWSVNYVRVGTLILCLHDAADYLLEGAKLARYVNKRMLCDILFGLFMSCWFITRLCIYPYAILWTTSIDSTQIAGYSPSLIIFNLLLWVLQVLHIFWFKLIVKVAIAALTTGKVEKDVRSASEESCDDTSSTSSASTKHSQNGKSPIAQ